MEYGPLSICYGEDGKEIWDSKHRGNMVHMTDVEIVSTVNAEIRGMYNYYSIANKCKSFCGLQHVADPVCTQYVCNFMRIGDQCGCTVRRQNNGQLRRTDHRRFYVYMCVDQSGSQDFSGNIQLL